VIKADISTIALYRNEDKAFIAESKLLEAYDHQVLEYNLHNDLVSLLGGSTVENRPRRTVSSWFSGRR
jgi:hypothetical protein